MTTRHPLDMKLNSSILLIITALAAIIASCTAPAERSAYQTMPSEGWAYADTVTLHADTSAAAPMGRVAVAVRHRADLEWANLWVELTYAAADTLRRDTVSIQLADPRGRWLGTGVGVGYQRVDTVQGLRAKGGSPISVRHVMRPDVVEGIEQVGVIFVPE